MKKVLLVCSVMTLMFTACKKDDAPKQVTPTKENLTGTYVITAASYNYNGTSTNVFNNSDQSMNEFEACDRDDQYKLNADLSYQVVDAGTVCSPDNNYSGSWNLVNSTTISIDGDNNTIKSFDGKTLVVTMDMGGGANYSQTLVKQ